jgi:hypothetical protein
MHDLSIAWFASFTLSLSIGALALVLRKKTLSWTHPAVLFALLWCFSTLCPILGVPELVASPAAMAFIFAAVLAFGLPAFFIDWRPATAAAASRNGMTVPAFSGYGLLYLFFLLEALTLLSMAANLQYQGYRLGSLIADPLSVGCQYLEARYEGTVRPNVFSQAGTILNYIAAPLGGLIVGSRKSRAFSALVLGISILPSLLAIFLYADKGAVFLTISYFYGAVIVARTAAGDTALLTKRTIMTCVLVTALLLPAITLAMINRGEGSCTGGNRTSQAAATLGAVFRDTAEKAESGMPPSGPESATSVGSALTFKLRSYAFGHLFAFSDWFDHELSGTSKMTYVDPQFRTWGFWTFMAVGRFVLPQYYATLPAGYFDEYYRQENVLSTNIYTMFRGLVYDFSLPGAILAMLVGGWIAGLAYRRMLISPEFPVTQAFYIFFCGFAYTSYIISLLIWSSVYAAAAGLFLVLMLLQWFGNRQQLQHDAANGEALNMSPPQPACEKTASISAQRT